MREVWSSATLGKGGMMKSRTREQETRYVMALGYAWGRKDSTPYGSDNAKRNLTADSMAFATFYAMYEEMAQHHRTLEQAWDYFTQLKLDEQRAYGNEWQRAPWNPYEAHNA